MSSSRNRILVVDDNAALVDNLQEILTDAGFVVLTASSCTSAVSAAKGGFDVALVDMRLPDGLGTDLLRALKATHSSAEFILLTGYSTVEAASAAMKAGAFAYLPKPCATDDLLLHVKQAQRQVQAQADKQAMARRIQASEKLAAVGTMTAGLSHEIRNPLNAAGLQLSVLEHRIEKLADEVKSPLLAPLHLIRDEIERLDHLLEDFLHMARPREPDLTRVDLGALVGRVLDLFEQDAERRLVHIHRHFEAEVSVDADEYQLRQVVMNLCLNALEASPENGRIEVTVGAAHTGVELTIDDSGSGVPPELRERIFEPFFTTKAQGSGLGLPIVRAIIIQHGGSLEVFESSSGGARFVVSLPRHP